MIKNSIFLVFLVLLADLGWSQTQKPTKVETKQQPKQEPQEQKPGILTEHFYKKYMTALQWNDYDVAKDALYDLIIENPKNDSLISNLAYLYFESEKYVPATLVSQELLARNPKNLPALEMSAVGYEVMGVKDRSLQNYESLYLLSNQFNYLYKMSFLQYDLKRYAECLASVDILLANKEVEAAKVVFNDATNTPKEYSMRLAVLNLKGMAILEHLGDKAAAKAVFEEILAAAPDFVPAKQNMAKVK